MEKLATYLASKGISQKQFAALVNIHPSVISRFLRGEAKPSLDTAFIIERATKGRVKAASWTSEVQQ